MNVKTFAAVAVQKIKINSPEILTVLGVIGLAGTAYLAVRAGKQANCLLAEEEPDLSIKEQAQLTWKLYIPPVVVGATTAACIIGSNQASGRRTAATVAAYSITEKAYRDYRDQVVEQVSKGKDGKILDAVAQERVTENPPPPRAVQEIVTFKPGEVLCCCLEDMRWFKSSMEKLKSAELHVNLQLSRGERVTLNDFYDYLGVYGGPLSDRLGWVSETPVELRFTSVLSEDNQPALALGFSYLKPLR